MQDNKRRGMNWMVRVTQMDIVRCVILAGIFVSQGLGHAAWLEGWGRSAQGAFPSGSIIQGDTGTWVFVEAAPACGGNGWTDAN